MARGLPKALHQDGATETRTSWRTRAITWFCRALALSRLSSKTANVAYQLLTTPSSSTIRRRLRPLQQPLPRWRPRIPRCPLRNRSPNSHSASTAKHRCVSLDSGIVKCGSRRSASRRTANEGSLKCTSTPLPAGAWLSTHAWSTLGAPFEV